MQVFVNDYGDRLYAYDINSKTFLVFDKKRQLRMEFGCRYRMYVALKKFGFKLVKEDKINA